MHKKNIDKAISFRFSKSNFYEICNVARRTENFLFNITTHLWSHNTILGSLYKYRDAIGGYSAKWNILGVPFPLGLTKVARTQGSKFHRAREMRRRARSREYQISSEARQLLPRFWNRTQLRTLARLPISAARYKKAQLGAGTCEHILANADTIHVTPS